MNSGDSRRIDAPPFSDRRIIQTADELTRNYVRATKPDPLLPLTISFDHVYENYIYPTYEIRLEEDCDLGCDTQGKKILGTYDLQTNTAYIDASLGPGSRDPRRVFTCWHEVGGHGVLQGDWLRRELAHFDDLRPIVTTDESIDRRTQCMLERQANLFAAHAAAPTWFVRHVIQKTYDPARPIRYLGPGRYCLSVNTCTVFKEVDDFKHLCWIVADYISSRFGGLSNEALGYRLAEMRFVVDANKPGFRLNRVARAPNRSSGFSPVLAISPAPAI